MSIYRDGALASEATAAAGVAKRRLLSLVRVASPCNVPWDEMSGDDRVRFCGSCEKNVYDLSAMTAVEAEDFLADHTEGDACVRFFQRADGTILTADCPVGVQRKRKRWTRIAKAAAGIVATAVGASAVAQAGNDDDRRMPGECMGACAPIGAAPATDTPASAVYK
jgi:hypothetical protein